MKKLFAPLLLSFVVLLLAGCASHIEATTAGLQADLLKIQRAGNGDLLVTWRVRNPNVVSYVLTKNSLKLSLDGIAIGTLEGQQRFGIPSMNEMEQNGVLPAPSGAAAEAVTRALQRGSANYTLNATLWLLIVDDDVERFNLSGSGSVPVVAK